MHSNSFSSSPACLAFWDLFPFSFSRCGLLDEPYSVEHCLPTLRPIQQEAHVVRALVVARVYQNIPAATGIETVAAVTFVSQGELI